MSRTTSMPGRAQHTSACPGTGLRHVIAALTYRGNSVIAYGREGVAAMPANRAAGHRPTQELDDGPDPYLWLEDVDSVAALTWARERNAEAEGLLVGSPRFDALYGELREVLDSDDRIPSVVRRGEWLYNFWPDVEHPRGVWRRTTLAQYRTAAPQWELLLDVDQLAETEGENWVWQGAAVLHPTLDRALVQL